jgi:phage minor structural protein
VYTIYADGKPLYVPSLFHEGCGVFSPKLTVELNKSGSLEFTMPPNNGLYDSVSKLKTIITAYQNGEEIFRGRVLHDEKDFYKQKKTYCEGELAFLLDSTQRPHSFSGTVPNLFKQYISSHNARVEKDKQFTVGQVTLSGDISFDSYDYPTTLDAINDQIMGNFGGRIRIRNENGTRYIDLLASETADEVSTTIKQTIEFGVNLLDITEYITAEDVFTIIIPLGATLEDSEGGATNDRLTIKGVNNGKDYIENSSAISLFGRIERKVEWTEVEDAAKLKSLGTDYLNNSIEMAVSLSVKAVDLHMLNVDTEQIRLGDWVQVISLPHGLNRPFQCTKIIYDMENPDQNEYSFGVEFTTLTTQQVNNKKNMQNSVSMVLSTAGAVNASVSKVNQASKDVENVIAQLPTDYVKTGEFEAYQTEVEEDFSGIRTDYEDLLARVIILEGGTA